MNPDAPFLVQVWQDSGPFVVTPLILLALMLLWMILNTVEHLVRCGDMAWQSTSFLRVASPLLEQNKWQELLAIAQKYSRSHVAQVFAATLRAFFAALERVASRHAIEVAEQADRVAANKIRSQSGAGVNGLKAIALTAPLVGLFGTSVRLLDWFNGYVGDRYWHVVLTFWLTAEALVPILEGLFVGIIAVWWFNWRVARVEKLDTQMRVASLKLLNALRVDCRSL